MVLEHGLNLHQNIPLRTGEQVKHTVNLNETRDFSAFNVVETFGRLYKIKVKPFFNKIYKELLQIIV